MNVKWENPPDISRTTRMSEDELRLANELRANPDQWARMTDFTGSRQSKAGALAQNIRSGKRASFKVTTEDVGEFEAVSRKVKGTDITAVYVRYATLNND